MDRENQIGLYLAGFDAGFDASKRGESKKASREFAEKMIRLGYILLDAFSSLTR